MYSLLNQIAATGKESYEASGAMRKSLEDSSDAATLYSIETGLRGLTDDEKRLVGISTISVVTRLALEFQKEEVRVAVSASPRGIQCYIQVTRLTISMLLQRLRTAEPTVEAAIAYNLVDLALEAPETAFADIIKVFSQINRSANPDDPRFSNNMVRIAFFCSS